MVEQVGNYEHIWAQQLLVANDDAVAVKQFGCSDCRCISHLFYFRKRPDAAILSQPGIQLRVVRIKGPHSRGENPT